MEETTQRKIALVTGGSRGVGAATVLALAEHGYDVALTYRNKAARANDVVSQVVALGGLGLAIGSDITNADDRTRLLQSFLAWRPTLDALILNASGGLEREMLAADPAYPMHINLDAQVAMVDLVLPVLRPGGVIVFVTSHWAHLYGHGIEHVPAYAPVAASKYAGEQALRRRQSEFAACDVRLAVVTGDLIEGTITPRLLERNAPGLSAHRSGSAGTLPTTADMGAAITDVVMDDTLPDGYTAVVGGTLESLLAQQA